MIDALNKAGVPCGPINDIAQFFSDPQARHRQMARKVAHPAGAELTLTRSPLDQSGSPAPYRAPPQLGQHTDDVLRDVLGLSAERIAQLRAAQVV